MSAAVQLYPESFKLIGGTVPRQNGKFPSVQMCINQQYVEMLVDSGSAVTVLPKSMFGGVKVRRTATLQAINGSKIKTYGRAGLSFELANLSGNYDFVSGEVQVPVLGVDFLKKYGLQIDFASDSLSQNGVVLCSLGGANVHLSRQPAVHHNHTQPASSVYTQPASKQVQESTGLFATTGVAAAAENAEAQQSIAPTAGSVMEPAQPPQTIEELLAKYDQLFQPHISTASKHGVKHHIDLMDRPRYLRPYRLPLVHHAAVKEKFDQMLENAVIRPSASPHASPLVVVAKKDGSIRPCVDYRALNKCTEPDSYTMPRVDDLMQTISGKVFSQLDLKDGFHQIEVAEKDIEKTAVATPWGLYEYLRMPFGLKNASATFQRFMDEVLRGLPNVRAYVDDVVVFSDSAEEHYNHLCSVLDRLSMYGLTINKQKSHFGKASIVFLGYSVDETGYTPPEEALPKIANFEQPKSVKDVQKFVGLINYYRAHVPSLADIATPLYLLTSKQSKFVWTEEAEVAFAKIKEVLSQRIPLRPARLGVPFTLTTDASGVAIGGVLTQDESIVGHFSRRLTTTEQRYSTFDREALAIAAAVKHFKHFLEGAEVHVLTDHKPLTYWLERPPTSQRHAAWLVEVQGIIADITHVPGEDNCLADYLSRNPELAGDVPTVNATQFQSMLEEVAQQQTETFIQSVRGPSVTVEKVGDIWCETSTGENRVILPEPFRNKVLHVAHSVGHYGVKRTQRILCKDYFWPKMKKDIANHVKNCSQCQRYKPTPTKPREPLAFPASYKFQCVHIDLVGPLPPSSKGNSYLLTAIDRFSGWVEATPMASITAEACGEEFIKMWVSRFGVPEEMVTDQGAQFEAHLFNKLCNKMSIIRKRTTAYHPQTNGKVERMHRTLKDSLRCLADRFVDWEDALPSALLAIRCAIGASGFSPCVIIYGETLALPHNLCSKEEDGASHTLPPYVQRLSSNMQLVKSHLCRDKPCTTTHTGEARQLHWVWLKDETRKNTLSPRYTGPYRVRSSSYPTVEIERNGKPYTTNIDRIKPAWQLQSTTGTTMPQIEDVEQPIQNQLQLPAYTTRAGRAVHPPQRLVL